VNVVFFGASDPAYPRNVVLREALASVGAQSAIVAVSPQAGGLSRTAGLLSRWFARGGGAGADAILVPSFAHKDVSLARPLARLAGLPVVFDPLVSRWDTQVGDLGRVRAGSVTAARLRASDKAALRGADLVLCDTWEHGDFLSAEYGVPRRKLARVPVGADHLAFDRGAQRVRDGHSRGDALEVVYIGGFLPLHGVDVVIDAATLLERRHGPSFARFALIGGGMTAHAADREIAARGLRSVRHVPRMPYPDAIEALARADAALGIFGTTPKAARVVPHKAYQGARGRRAARVEALARHGGIRPGRGGIPRRTGGRRRGPGRRDRAACVRSSPGGSCRSGRPASGARPRVPGKDRAASPRSDRGRARVDRASGAPMMAPRALRILHVDSERTWRGGERQVLELMRRQRTRGDEPHLAAPRGSVLLSRASSEGFPGHAVPMRGAWDLGSAFALAGLHRRLRPDVVHWHAARAHALGAVASLIAPGPARVLSRRVDFPVRGSAGSRLLYGLRRDATIAISEGVRDALVRSGLDPASLAVVRSGIDLTPFDAPFDRSVIRSRLGIHEGDFLVLQVAALAPHKSQKDLLDAARIVLAERPEARIWVAGEGILRDELERQHGALDLGDRVRLLGFRDDVPDLLRSADLFCVSSYLEGMGTATLDAMAVGSRSSPRAWEESRRSSRTA
jgi:glycosyltransferase involved in cell wall biosynthesis